MGMVLESINDLRRQVRALAGAFNDWLALPGGVAERREVERVAFNMRSAGLVIVPDNELTLRYVRRLGSRQTMNVYHQMLQALVSHMRQQGDDYTASALAALLPNLLASAYHGNAHELVVSLIGPYVREAAMEDGKAFDTMRDGIRLNAEFAAAEAKAEAEEQG